jgi:hypothetical protein
MTRIAGKFSWGMDRWPAAKFAFAILLSCLVHKRVRIEISQTQLNIEVRP